MILRVSCSDVIPGLPKQNPESISTL